MDRALIEWYRSGFEDRMRALAQAEERTTVATQLCVDHPTLESRTAAAAAADEFVMAARGGGRWLATHPAPRDEVKGPFVASFAAYLEAAEVLVGMGEELSKMTKVEGGKAAAAVARAKSANYDGAMAYARLVNA